MVSKKIVSRGDVVIPIDGGVPASLGQNYLVVGPHLYLGKNKWFEPSGRVTSSQNFHRLVLLYIKRKWWQVVL